MKRVSLTLVLLLAIVITALPAGAQNSPTQITLWRHTSDLQAELDANRSAIEAFNASQSDWEVTWEELPKSPTPIR